MKDCEGFFCLSSWETGKSNSSGFVIIGVPCDRLSQLIGMLGCGGAAILGHMPQGNVGCRQAIETSGKIIVSTCPLCFAPRYTCAFI
jgi:hypothetical protein